MSSQLHKIVQRIDWKMLRRQKLWLLKHPPTSSATGLIALIDAIQDAALADLITDEEIIFGTISTNGISHDC